MSSSTPLMVIAISLSALVAIGTAIGVTLCVLLRRIAQAIAKIPPPQTHVDLVAVRHSANIEGSQINIKTEIGELHGADTIGTTALQLKGASFCTVSACHFTSLDRAVAVEL